jgi:hypothetical protein
LLRTMYWCRDIRMFDARLQRLFGGQDESDDSRVARMKMETLRVYTTMRDGEELISSPCQNVLD